MIIDESLTPEQEELLALLLSEDRPDVDLSGSMPSAEDAVAVTDTPAFSVIDPAMLPPAVVQLRAGGSQAPLFVVGAFHFRTLAKHLDVHRPVYGLAGVNLDTGNGYMRRIEDMAGRYAEQIRQVQPHGPYLLVGFCFGGLVAYEIAQQLRSAGEEIAFLGVIDMDAPSSDTSLLLMEPSAATGKKATKHLARLLERGPAYLGKWVAARYRHERFYATLRAHAALGKLFSLAGWKAPERLHEGMTFQADVEAERSYRPKPYDGAMTIIICAETDQNALEPRTRDVDGGLGWRRHVRKELTVLHASGDHASVLQEPHVRTLALQFQQVLAKTERARHSDAPEEVWSKPMSCRAPLRNAA